MGKVKENRPSNEAGKGWPKPRRASRKPRFHPSSGDAKNAKPEKTLSKSRTIAAKRTAKNRREKSAKMLALFGHKGEQSLNILAVLTGSLFRD